MSRFRITITSDNVLTLDELWPDGDAPENPTADDVRARIRQHGGAREVLRDWNLDDELTLDVVEVES